MTYFAAVLARGASERWQAVEVSLEDCESIADIADVARDVRGDLRLVVIEQDDEYAAVVRIDGDDSDARAFLSDGHAADAYSIAAVIADELSQIGADPIDDDDVPAAHESAPLGDAEIVEDLGTPASDLLSMCAHEGTLPIDVLVAVCEKAGCGEVFDDLRA